jgi:ATP-binding cassette, subfamily B, bacterial
MNSRSRRSSTSREWWPVIAKLRNRQETKFFAELWRASPGHALAWWVLLAVRACMPSLVSIAFGWLVSAITLGHALTGPLVLVGVAFGAIVTLLPVHQFVSMNLGSLMANHLYGRLMHAGISPDGIAHLERPEFTNDLTMARDFDQGIMGPPLAISMDFITGGLLDLFVGVVAGLLLFGFAWWAPFVLIVGWVSTHWLLRESGVWKDRNTDEVRTAQRHADYSYRLAVDAGPAKELRFFGLSGWVTDRFVDTRRKLYDLQYEATRLREKSVLTCLVIVVATNLLVFLALAAAARNGELSTGRIVVFVQAAIGVSAIAFGGLNWALDGASAPVVALRRLESAMAQAGALSQGTAEPAQPAQPVVGTTSRGPAIQLKNVTFAYEAESGRNIFDGFSLAIPAGTSMAIVGSNGAGKTTLAKLLCRLYDPDSGSIEIDGTPLVQLPVAAWRRTITAVFQDFIRFELPLRTNVAPLGAPDDVIVQALGDAGGNELADGDLDTILSKAYPGGTDLSGGQWQRVALARALCAVRQGAEVVLLDEPTAQLDVRGESEIFERVLTATKGCTTILISHRFSTVRLADSICVLQNGRVLELGSHNELMALGGRYREMFELQASRFAGTDVELDEAGKEIVRETL